MILNSIATMCLSVPAIVLGVAMFSDSHEGSDLVLSGTLVVGGVASLVLAILSLTT